MTEPASPRIPMVDLRAEIDDQWDELQEAIAGVLRSGTFILGPNVAAFEREAADFLGCPHAVAVGSGTDAIALGLQALGVGPGDEVVTTPFTFVATAEAIAQLGAVPVFADIDPSTLLLDPERVGAAVTPRTRAVVPVHLFGNPAPTARLQALGLPVVEDAAQAFGARDDDGGRVGAHGAVGCFSFFPTKPLACFGDGGLVATGDAGVAAAVRRLRAHGATRKHHSEQVGRNSRLDELQAAVLRVRLAHVDRLTGLRRAAGRRYQDGLAGIPHVVPPAIAPGGAFSVSTIRITGGRRPAVVAALTEAGIASDVLYPVPLHRLPPYARPGVECPEADRAASEVLSLPLWPTIPGSVVDEVVGTIARALGG